MKPERSAKPAWCAALLALWLAGCALSPSQKAEIDAALRIKPERGPGRAGKFAASPPAPAALYGATLEMVSVQFDYDEHLRFLVPLLLPIVGTMVGEFEVRTRMTMQLGLNDAQGQQVWTRSYDDGPRTGIWVYPGGYAVRTGDPDWQAGVSQMAHGAAARLAQQVVQDLREWHEAQRLKPRSL